MRSTFGAPLRIVTNVVKLTAALIAEIEGHLWKSLKVEKLRGSSEATSTITTFHEIAAKFVRGGLIGGTGALILGATTLENIFEAEVDNLEPEKVGNFYAILPTVAGSVRITGLKYPAELKEGTLEGLPLILYNNRPVGSGENVTLVVASPKSEAANQFAAGAAEIVLEPHQAAVFFRQAGNWKLAART